MKKVLMMALTIMISVAFVTVVFAQTPAGTSEQKTTTTTTTATPEKKVTTTTTETTKSKAMWFRGRVTAMDTAAKMMTVKGEKGDMTFDVSNAKMKGEAKAGDRVRVKYMEKDGKMMASWVNMRRAKTTKTTTTKTTETKEETTAPAK
jgi:microtubule-associated protein 1